MYVNRKGNSVVIVALYIDDTLLLSDNMEFLTLSKLKLRCEFEMTDHGEIHYCLGIEVLRNREKRIIHLSRRM